MAPSRRRTHSRRQASEDIEEGATQVVAREDVDDEEEEDEKPARSRKVAKKEKGVKAVKAIPSVDEDDDDDEPIDVENFANQPLQENDGLKLKGLSNDWSQMITSVMGNVSTIGDVGAALIEHGDKKDAERYKKEVDTIMKDFIAIESTMGFHALTLDEIRQKLAQGETVVDIVSRYNAGVTQKEAAHKKKTSRQKYAKDDTYREFRQTVWEAEMPDTAMPPMTELIPKEDGDDSEDDDEIEIGGVTQDYKCPLTLCIIEDPVTSRKCNHHFSQAAIRDLFGGRTNVTKRCPASGCHQDITLADCRPDPNLAKKIKAFQRRQKRKEDAMEVDEVIE
ncbi:hypothetical protein BDZ89DRAFT_1104765 [Hymenopellis radicata]|nr:hypothetical protein BDZ89DRAFT_1104765 [Hymenopellis radicata]